MVRRETKNTEGSVVDHRIEARLAALELAVGEIGKRLPDFDRADVVIALNSAREASQMAANIEQADAGARASAAELVKRLQTLMNLIGLEQNRG